MLRRRRRTKVVTPKLRRIKRFMGICLLLMVVCGPVAILSGNYNIIASLLPIAFVAFGCLFLSLYKYLPEMRLCWDAGQVEKARIAAGQCDESWWAMPVELRSKILLFEFNYLGEGETIETFERENLPIWITYYLVVKYNLAQALYLMLEEPENVEIPFAKLAYIQGDLWDAAYYMFNPNVEYRVVRELSGPARTMVMDTLRKYAMPVSRRERFMKAFGGLCDYGEIRGLTPPELLEGYGVEMVGDRMDEKFDYPAGYGTAMLQRKTDIVLEHMRKRGLLKW